jgi:hypothetical protein
MVAVRVAEPVHDQCCFISGASLSATPCTPPTPQHCPWLPEAAAQHAVPVNSNVQHDLWESAHACIERVLHSSLWLPRPDDHADVLPV